MAEVFTDTTFSVTSVPGNGTGDHIMVRSRACDGDRSQVLLVGHMDTVFPADTAFTGYSDDGDHCHGPGVIDMKGGLVAGIYALKALDHCGDLEGLPVTFIFNADEEIGSPASRELIRREAARSTFAFVLECGGANGEVVTGRKGNLTLRITVKGRAEHRQGVSDANIIAAEKVPVIDGFGPLGARDHSEEEYMVRKSLPQRALLVAAALTACWQDHLAGRL